MDSSSRSGHPLDRARRSPKGRGDAGRALGATRVWEAPAWKNWTKDASLLSRQPPEAQNPGADVRGPHAGL